LSEPGSDAVHAALEDAEHVFASDLTLVECDRALIRAETLLEPGATGTEQRRALLQRTSARWTVLPLGPAVIDRARRPFPAEPIRTLDALHLASALGAAETRDDLAMLSLDHRIRISARALGLSVLPVA
jgi:predicted nucleic acid-binding protein